MRRDIRGPMQYGIAGRAMRIGRYVVNNRATVRDAAAAFGISKSTAFLDVTGRLARLHAGLAADVREVLAANKEARALRGGLATKEKWEEGALHA